MGDLFYHAPYMIYGLSSWEKIDRTQPWLLTNGDVVVIQKPKFLTSPNTYILSIFLTIVGTASIAESYFSGEPTFTLTTINPVHILAGLSTALGIWISAQVKTGIALRKEQGGIHPTDTLLVLDGSRKDVKKQIGTTEELITSFENMQFEIEIRRNSKQNQYRIQIVYPQGKEHIVTATTQKSSDALLQNIKTRLHIT